MLERPPRTAIHPDLRRAARLLPGGGALRFGLRVPRLTMTLAGRFSGRSDVEEVRIDQHVSVRMHRPSAETRPTVALLWIHGGGYVLGQARADDAFCHHLADLLGITVAAVEYRLAPEHRFPTPVADCHTALAWLADQPGIDRVAIAGGSAGGGLAAALAFWAREQGMVDVAWQGLVYPMLDHRTGLEPTGTPYLLWDERDNVIGWRHFLGDADPMIASPARRTDLAGLPPAWIGVGDLDLFHAESSTYAERLRAAGVRCDLTEVPGAFHAFDQLALHAPLTQGFLADFAASLDAALAGSPTGVVEPGSATGDDPTA